MDRFTRIVVAGLPVMLVVALVVLGRTVPGYFNNQQYLAAFVFLQILLAALWFYDRFFFPFLMIAFFWAGMDLPFNQSWTMGRWIVLGAGAIVGFARAMRMGVHRYHPFHLAAMFCVGSAFVSAMVSVIPQFALMKALSLMMLFLYGASGARLVMKNPDRFFRGLLFACEISVYGSAFAYLVLGSEIWGNGNSLGAVEGVAAAPILLWGALVAPAGNLRLRRAIGCVGALYLVYFSVSRAAMMAALLSMLVLLVSLRRNRLIVQGLVGVGCVIAITAIGAPRHFDDIKTSFVEGVIYKGHQDQGLLGSRLPPWQEAVQIIGDNPYFGSGFGTSTTGDKPFGEGGRFSSDSLTNREHGSSYLAITEWVGLLGIIPFLILLVFTVQAVARVCRYLRRTGNVSHYSAPLMMVMISGLFHAGFEDWLFAVGYYLTVFFWVLAFILIDVAPDLSAQQTAFVHGMRFRYAADPAPIQH
ncbi:MAG: O-antigen ligase family protein [Acidobacteria bacterium]|nr:O-antigen ligase family protein [Acidobacteriota bacterium]